MPWLIQKDEFFFCFFLVMAKQQVGDCDRLKKMWTLPFCGYLSKVVVYIRLIFMSRKKKCYFSLRSTGTRLFQQDYCLSHPKKFCSLLGLFIRGFQFWWWKLVKLNHIWQMCWLCFSVCDVFRWCVCNHSCWWFCSACVECLYWRGNNVE